MKKAVAYLAISALSVSLVGCSNMNKQDVGVLAGGAVGGLLGSQFGSGGGQIAAAVGGAVLGGFIGGAIGHNMDETDKLKAQQALEDNRTGQASSWSNPDQHRRYRVTPTKTYYRDGHPCRNYTMLVTMSDGKAEKVHGRACRVNGKWVQQK